MWETLIGSLSTIIGVVVGFSLKYITEIGKIKIYLNDLNIHYRTRDKSGGVVEVEYYEENSSIISGCRVYFDIDILNTSGKNKVIRNFQIQILNNTKQLVRGEIGDIDTKTRQGGSIIMNTPRPFTILPNNLVNKRLEYLIGKDVPDLRKCSFYFIYRNKKNKLFKEELNIKDYFPLKKKK